MSHLLTALAALLLFTCLLPLARRRLRRHLWMWRTDPITGLPPSRVFRAQAANIVDRPDACAIYVDLPRLNSIRHLYGHRAGDAVLAEVAQRMREHLHRRASALGHYGTALARLHDSGFGAIVTLGSTEWEEEIQALTDCLNKPLSYDGRKIPTHVFVGALHFNGAPPPTAAAAIDAAELLALDATCPAPARAVRNACPIDDLTDGTHR